MRSMYFATKTIHQRTQPMMVIGTPINANRSVLVPGAVMAWAMAVGSCWVICIPLWFNLARMVVMFGSKSGVSQTITTEYLGANDRSLACLVSDR